MMINGAAIERVRLHRTVNVNLKARACQYLRFLYRAEAYLQRIPDLFQCFLEPFEIEYW